MSLIFTPCCWLFGIVLTVGGRISTFVLVPGEASALVTGTNERNGINLVGEADIVFVVVFVVDVDVVCG